MNFTGRFPEIQRTDSEYVYSKSMKRVPRKVVNIIESLKIPKVYSPLWVDPKQSSDLCAIALDSKGRKQYYYSSTYTTQRRYTKIERMYKFILNLPKLKRQTRRDMKSPRHSKLWVVSNLVYLLEHTFLRIGNKKYLQRNESYGLTTLKHKHVTLCPPNTVRLEFPGKHQVVQTRSLSNDNVYAFIKELRTVSKRPNDYLFTYTFQDRQCVVSADDVNEYLGRFSCKDYRTYGANVLFVETLRGESDPKRIPEAYRTVSSKLGNSAAVLKSSYILPQVEEYYCTRKGFGNKSLKYVVEKIISNNKNPNTN